MFPETLINLFTTSWQHGSLYLKQKLSSKHYVHALLIPPCDILHSKTCKSLAADLTYKRSSCIRWSSCSWEPAPTCGRSGSSSLQCRGGRPSQRHIWPSTVHPLSALVRQHLSCKTREMTKHPTSQLTEQWIYIVSLGNCEASLPVVGDDFVCVC